MKPVLLMYCQHSLGIGHLTRSFAIADALTRVFDVVFLNGGRLPPGIPVPPAVSIVDLPPLGMEDGHSLMSRDDSVAVPTAQALRRACLLQVLEKYRPAALVVELFPFGRKKFAFELLPLLKRARAMPRPPVVVCSLRDILVASRPDQQHHDDRAAFLCERYFDAVLVHADPQLAQLEDTFKPRRPLRTPVQYTGFVVPSRPTSRVPRAPDAPLLVSAGGGIVGFPLFRLALDAHAGMDSARTPPLRIVAGPFLPESEWTALQQLVRGRSRVTLVRSVPDLVAEMGRSAASLSQCGYNTALDIVRAGVPALVVPYGDEREDEQRNRAGRLADLGALRWVPATGLGVDRLRAEIQATLEFRPLAHALSMEGAATTSDILAGLVSTAGASRRHG